MIFPGTPYQNCKSGRRRLRLPRLISRYLISKFKSKSTAVLHVGKFCKKQKTLFQITFFKFHLDVIRFYMKTGEKGYLSWFLSKISWKIEKQKTLSNFLNIWHKDVTKHQRFQEIFTYWRNLRKMLQYFENFYFMCFAKNFVKFFIANTKMMIATL